MAPWWLRASDDEQLADSPAELEAFAQEEEPVLASPAEPAPAQHRAAPEPAEDDDAEAAEEAAEAAADDSGEPEDGEAEGEAKAGGVRRRRRRRRGRRGGGAAPSPLDAAAEEAAEGDAADEEDGVPLFDSPRALQPETERAPILAPPPPVVESAPAEPPAPWYRPAAAGTVKTEPFRLFVPPVSSVEPMPERPAARQPEPSPVAPAPAMPIEPAVAHAAPVEPPRTEPEPRPASGRKPAPPSRPPAPAVPAYAPPAPASRSVPRPEPPRPEPSYAAAEMSPMALEPLPKAYVYTVPERPASPADERKIAMFVDFENIALGVRDSEVRTFDMTLILERLLEKGKIIVKKAYADWERYSEYKRPFHEAAIELIDIPQKFYSGKNSADIKMVVDAMDLCYSKEHLDTFVLVSGDSDFSPLVSKLKENNKYVIGLGVKNSSSSLLIDNCDEFIYYEDVWRDTQRVPRLDHLAPKEAECFQLMCESIVALLRENKEVLWGSLVKQTMQRKRPSFAEGYYGYGTFTELLEDAERKNIIRLRRDQRSGTYIVIGFVPPRSKRSFQV